MEKEKGEQPSSLIISPINFNKVGKYYEEEDLNTTLPIEHDKIQIVVILDNGAEIRIITKEMWKQWGSRVLQTITMIL